MYVDVGAGVDVDVMLLAWVVRLVKSEVVPRRPHAYDLNMHGSMSCVCV